MTYHIRLIFKPKRTNCPSIFHLVTFVDNLGLVVLFTIWSSPSRNVGLLVDLFFYPFACQSVVHTRGFFSSFFSINHINWYGINSIDLTNNKNNSWKWMIIVVGEKWREIGNKLSMVWIRFFLLCFLCHLSEMMWLFFLLHWLKSYSVMDILFWRISVFTFQRDYHRLVFV